jgi:hypothetical protein
VFYNLKKMLEEAKAIVVVSFFAPQTLCLKPNTCLLPLLQVFYDLKKLLEESKATVPAELARSEAAKMKPGSISQKRDSIQYAKK